MFEEDSDAAKLFLVLSGVAQVVAKPELASSIRRYHLSRTGGNRASGGIETIFGVQLDRNTLVSRDAPPVPNSRAKERRPLWRNSFGIQY